MGSRLQYAQVARTDVKDTDKAVLACLKKTKFMVLVAFYMDVMRSLSAIPKVCQRADLSLQVVTETVHVHPRTLTV